MQDQNPRGEAVPEPRHRKRRILAVALLAATLVAGMVGIGARVDRQQTPNVELIPGAHDFRMAMSAPERTAQARTAPEPDDGDDDLDELGRFALSSSLAVIVRMADRLPQGHPARQALADASVPIRDALFTERVRA